jgi:hypothetical protein
MNTLNESRKMAPFLWILLFLFILRVTGQASVAFIGVDFLPPMREWDSGLIPYRLLLMAQIAIIALMTKICIDFARGSGFFITQKPAFGKPALYFGYLYLTAMIFRYVLRMALIPEARWFGGTIPIFFHYVLATFVILFAKYHTNQLHLRGTQ